MECRTHQSRRAVAVGGQLSEPLYAAVDLGGANIAAAIGTRDGRILGEVVCPTQAHEGPLRVLARIASLVRQLADTQAAPVAAVGMGIPGLVDIASGATRFLPNLPTQWRDVPAAAILAAKAGCPVYLLNDARMAALGELEYGWGRTASTFAFLTIGTGIGGAIIIDGKLRLGPLGAAGEIGHQTIVADGPLCGCGNRGCLEALASGPAMIGDAVRTMLAGLAPGLHEIAGGSPSAVTPRTIAEAAGAGDGGALAVIERAALYLGIGIANMVTALDPDMVVLGGGVAGMGEALLVPVRRVVQDRVRMFPVDHLRIEASLVTGNAALPGGLALAFRAGVI